MGISIQQAIALIQQHTSPLPATEVPLSQSVDRLLARDLTAAIDQPPFARSPLDGYALRAADSTGATADSPVQLPVSGYYPAGVYAAQPLEPGHAARIMTGGMIPPGADAVIRQEDTCEQDGIVSLYTPLKAWQNYVPQGDDFTKGRLLLKEGQRLDAAAIAIAAAAGLHRLIVLPRPRLAMLSTGDELRQPGQPLPPGCIYDANVSYLQARAAQLRLPITSAASAQDDLSAIMAGIRQGLDQADLLLTSGGISVGDKDLLPEALERVGARTLFHGVAMKPGMPTLFALLEGKPILCLSGNPFAAAVAFEVLARPLLACLGQDEAMKPIKVSGVLTNGFERPTQVRRFLRARLEGEQITLPTGHANGNLFSMVGCNCLVDTGDNKAPLQAGERVEAWLL